MYTFNVGVESYRQLLLKATGARELKIQRYGTYG